MRATVVTCLKKGKKYNVFIYSIDKVDKASTLCSTLGMNLEYDADPSLLDLTVWLKIGPWIHKFNPKKIIKKKEV